MDVIEHYRTSLRDVESRYESQKQVFRDLEERLESQEKLLNQSKSCSGAQTEQLRKADTRCKSQVKYIRKLQEQLKSAIDDKAEVKHKYQNLQSQSMESAKLLQRQNTELKAQALESAKRLRRKQEELKTQIMSNAAQRAQLHAEYEARVYRERKCFCEGLVNIEPLGGGVHVIERDFCYICRGCRLVGVRRGYNTVTVIYSLSRVRYISAWILETTVSILIAIACYFLIPWVLNFISWIIVLPIFLVGASIWDSIIEKYVRTDGRNPNVVLLY